MASSSLFSMKIYRVIRFGVKAESRMGGLWPGCGQGFCPHIERSNSGQPAPPQTALYIVHVVLIKT